MVRDLKDKHALYYEVILQLGDVCEEVKEYTEAEIAKTELRIAKQLDVKGGQDYYLTDRDLTKKVAHKLQEKFGGEYKESASIYGQKDGKEIFRLTILYRGLSFGKGDLVDYRGTNYRVLTLGKKELVLQQESDGQKLRLRYKEAERIKKKQIS